MTRLETGDVIEIRTRLGFSYAQYTHDIRQYGALIRVFEHTYPERPGDIGQVVGDKVRFSVFFPLKAAVGAGIFSVVGNIPVREELQAFPVFRAGVVDPATGKVATWWLWDGKAEQKLGKLTEDQKKLPIRGVWNDTLLIERIESGWTPERDSTT